MTVKELIENLSRLDPNLPVCAYTGYGYILANKPLVVKDSFYYPFKLASKEDAKEQDFVILLAN